MSGKRILLILLLFCSLGATYRPRAIEHAYKFDNSVTLQQLTSLSGKWEIESPAKLNQPFLSQNVRYADFPKILVKDKDFYDFEVSTKMYISSETSETQAGGLILRYRNLYSFYMLFLNAKDKRITLTKAARGGMKPVIRINHEFTPDKWYELKAICYLDTIRAYVNGQQLLEAKDDTSTGGKVGLVTAGQSKIYFEGLQIKSETFDVIPQPQ